MTTKADLLRYRKLHDMGCIVSHLFYSAYRDADVHHITQGGRRMGNQFTLPLSPWLHRGVKNEAMSREDMEYAFGPSLAHSREAFENAFGTEMELLARVNEAIGAREPA